MKEPTNLTTLHRYGIKHIRLYSFLFIISISTNYAQAQIQFPIEVLDIDNEIISGKEMRALRVQYANARILNKQATSIEEACDPQGGFVYGWDNWKTIDSLITINENSQWEENIYPLFPFNALSGWDAYLMYQQGYQVPLRCDTLAKNGNDVGLYDAYKAGWYGNKQMIVAIVDTGLTLEVDIEPERLWVNEDEVYNDGIDNDNNGFIDDYYGYSFADSTHNWTVLNNDDNNFHGTHMSHIVAADGYDNFPGYGPDQNCKIMNLKVNFGGGINSISAIAQAVRYAVDNGAKIINVSIGSPIIKPTSWNNSEFQIEYNEPLTEALDYAWDQGAIIVGAVGNVSEEDFILQKSHYNKVANHPAVIAVGSIYNNVMGFFNIISYTGKKNDLVTFTYVNGSRGIAPGTSSSAAFVTSLISLYWGANMHLTNYQVKKAVLEAARDQIFDVGNKIDSMTIVFNGDAYQVLSEGEEPKQFYGYSKNDPKGWDEAYGYGFLSLTELVEGVKYREVTIDPETGSVNGYTRPTEILEEDYHLFSIPLAVKKIQPRFSVYPNPIQDYFNVENSNHENLAISIYDLAGHLIKENKKFENPMYIGDLKSGVYVVKIRTNKTECQSKIVKL